MKKIQRKVFGFSILEMSLGLILAALALSFAIEQKYREVQINAAQVQADQLKQLQKAVSNYIEQYRNEILNNDPILFDAGLTDGLGQIGLLADNVVGGLLNPTVEQLDLLNLLPTGFRTQSTVVDGQLQVELWREPAGCVGLACRIEGMIYIDQPIREANQGPGEYNGVVVGEILAQLGGYGFASVSQGAEVVAAGGNFTLNNPDPDNSAGVVGMLVGNSVNRRDMDPIPGLDYCPAGIYYFPKPTGTGTPRLVQPSEMEGLLNDGCLVSFDDIPRGYSFMTIDSDPPMRGWTRLKCEIQPNGGLALKDIGFTTGERACNNNSTSKSALENLLLDEENQDGLTLYETK